MNLRRDDPQLSSSPAKLSSLIWMPARCLAVAVLLALEGCGGNPAAGYVPRTDTARQAIESALAAWQSGAKYGPLNELKPAINVFDSRWQKGKSLERFEIVEEVTGSEHPQFRVRIKLAHESEAIETYRVVGIDPLNVFLEADYRRASGL